MHGSVTGGASSPRDGGGGGHGDGDHPATPESCDPAHSSDTSVSHTADRLHRKLNLSRVRVATRSVRGGRASAGGRGATAVESRGMPKIGERELLAMEEMEDCFDDVLNELLGLMTDSLLRFRGTPCCMLLFIEFIGVIPF